MSKGNKGDSFRLENYGGYEIRVTSVGRFEALEADGEDVAFQAPTLDALKKKIGEQREKVDIKAVILDHWEDGADEVVQVYDLTPAGNILYVDSHGYKQKARRYYNEIYVFDEAKMKERTRLRAQLKALKKELERLMKDWPKIQRREIKSS